MYSMQTNMPLYLMLTISYSYTLVHVCHHHHRHQYSSSMKPHPIYLGQLHVIYHIAEVFKAVV